MPDIPSSDQPEAANFEKNALKRHLFIIIFGTNTRAGKAFDIILLALILVSVAAVMLETVSFIDREYHVALRVVEWIVTGFFTLEYLARIWVVKKPRIYIFSVLGIIDLLSILPTYLSFFLVGSQSFAILRALRLLRIFRILKLVRFVSEAQLLGRALKSSRHKITVFFLAILILVFILGSIMYLIEGPDSGFVSIPRSIYWAIVTLTTVGFGDVTPQTVLGQLVASAIMLLGYSIIAIPTGIVGAEIYKEVDTPNKSRTKFICMGCGHEDHHMESKFCNNCGKKLTEEDIITSS
ncbi:MAG: voltage-gated potassium channel [Cryomorphaceae bacterium]|jgi:voltage-gated potassium channel